MRHNEAKMRMQQGLPCLGAVLFMGSGIAAEIMAREGYDFLLLDAQHGNWTLETAGDCIRRIYQAGSIPMVRVSHNDQYAIGSMLDRGALGVVVPMVETAEEAQNVAKRCIYGPRGKRSIGESSVRSWLPISDEEIDDEIFVSVQIETVRGLENAEKILSVDGIDGCWIGPSDLALSMGLDLKTAAGQRQHKDAIYHIIETCKKTNRVPGIATPGTNNEWLKVGCLFVTVGSDVDSLKLGARYNYNSFKSYRH
jgi:4-hydroxy-2-oxoheptanedioate aldolase